MILLHALAHALLHFPHPHAVCAHCHALHTYDHALAFVQLDVAQYVTVCASALKYHAGQFVSAHFAVGTYFPHDTFFRHTFSAVLFANTVPSLYHAGHIVQDDVAPYVTVCAVL